MVSFLLAAVNCYAFFSKNLYLFFYYHIR